MKDQICSNDKILKYYKVFQDEYENIHWAGMDISKSEINVILGIVEGQRRGRLASLTPLTAPAANHLFKAASRSDAFPFVWSTVYPGSWQQIRVSQELPPQP